MKIWLYLALVGMIVAGRSVALAGSGCCKWSQKQAGCQMAQSNACAALWSKLNLTDEQKAKVEAYQGQCLKDGCTPENRQKCMAGMESVLTPEQQAQWKAECSKMGKDGCPMMKNKE